MTFYCKGVRDSMSVDTDHSLWCRRSIYAAGHWTVYLTTVITPSMNNHSWVRLIVKDISDDHRLEKNELNKPWRIGIYLGLKKREINNSSTQSYYPRLIRNIILIHVPISLHMTCSRYTSIDMHPLWWLIKKKSTWGGERWYWRNQVQWPVTRDDVYLRRQRR